MKKILLAIPTSKYVEPECFQAVYEQKIPKEHKTELFIPAGYCVDVARNLVAKEALDRHADYIFWVDADIILPKNALCRLLSHGKDIVSGVYVFKVMTNRHAVVKRFKQGEKDRYENLLVDEILSAEVPLMNVDAFGFGCVLTKTEVFERIAYPQFIYTADMGEDVYFCRKAQNAGYELFLDSRVLCGHKGEVNYNIKAK